MKLPITPLQRWNIRELAYGKEAPKVKGGQEGRRFRRFARHLGIDVIGTALMAQQGRVSAKQVSSQAPAMHELDEDDRDRILDLAKLERDPGVEDILGPLFDLCEDWSDGKELAWTCPAPEGYPDFDASREDWSTPPPVPGEESPE